MLRFVARRVAGMVLVLFAVSVLTFGLFNVLPNGSPEERLAPQGASETQLELIRREWDFDEPVHAQYLTTMEKIFTGDVESYADSADVDAEIRAGLPRTISLTAGAAVLWLVLGVALGLYGAMRAGRLADRVLTVLALVGVSLPVFWIGALASYYLGFEAGIFPDGGYAEIGEEGLWEWARHLILPWVVLSILFVGVYSRVMRARVIETLGEDHVRTARAKGLPERRVIGNHVLRNAMAPMVALWGLDVGVALGGGAVLTETVFDLQGVGQYFAESINDLDVPPVLMISMIAALAIVVLNTVVDVVNALLDPRVRP